MSDLVRAPTLEFLAATATNEHRQAMESALTAVRHAVASGEALLEARRQIKVGEWCDWLEANVDIARQTARNYMRLATYRDLVLDEGGPSTIRGAIAILQSEGVPHIGASGGWNVKGLADDEIAEVKALRKTGKTWQSIADEMGIPRMRIQRVIDPTIIRREIAGRNRYQRRRTAERAALAAKERDDAVRRLGGTAAAAYALLRKTALVLDRAIAEREPGDEHQAMQAALMFTYRAEDEIVRALQLGRQLTPQQARYSRADRRAHQVGERA